MNIKVGDRVTVIGQSKYHNRLLIGKKGTVKSVESNLVRVMLDTTTNTSCCSGYFDFYPVELLIIGACCPYELRDVDDAILEKFNSLGLPNYVKSDERKDYKMYYNGVKSDERKDYKMYYNGVKIKIGNKFYCPDTVEWKQTTDTFPELEISTRISPSNLDPTSNLSITNVIFNPPATIVFWSDKTKTVVKCDPKEDYDPEKGIAMAICKKMIGDNKRDYYNVFLHWIKKYEKQQKERYESYVEYLFKNILNIGGDLEDD